MKHEIVKEDKENLNSNDETVGGGRRISFADETAAGPVTRSRAREIYGVGQSS